MSFEDLTGQVFTRLTITGRAPNREGSRSARWYAKCACRSDTVVEASSSELQRGGQKSCGCLQREASAYAAHLRAERAAEADARAKAEARIARTAPKPRPEPTPEEREAARADYHERMLARGMTLLAYPDGTPRGWASYEIVRLALERGERIYVAEWPTAPYGTWGDVRDLREATAARSPRSA